MKRLSKKKLVKHKRYLRTLERRRKQKTYRALRQLIALAEYIRFDAPRVFNLYETRERSVLLKLLSSFRKEVAGGATRILFDFGATEKFISDATLLFTAELTRAKRLYGGRLAYKCLLPKSNKAIQVMQQIGLLELFGAKSSIVPSDDDVVKWRYAIGQGATGERYDDIMGPYEGVITEALSSNLFTGITEAMTNAHHHAYLSPRKDRMRSVEDYKPWWMFSQERDGRLYVLFCDLGVGIPETIPQTRSELFANLITLGLSGSDASIIEKTIEDSRTRTKKKYRGKGLSQIVETVTAYEDSSAIIYSNKGAVKVNGGKLSPMDYADSIMGTLICWSLPLTGAIIKS